MLAACGVGLLAWSVLPDRTAVSVAAQVATTQPVRPIASIDRVLIISIDGLRPDLFLRANAPTLRGMLDRGSFSLWARTTAVSVTLPSHTSMLTGVTPEIHQIVWNGEMPFKEPVYPKRPTLFQLAKAAGYSTGMAAGKDKMDTLRVPGSVDHAWVTDKGVCTDQQVADEAVKIIQQFAPQVMFVHLPQVDSVGHAIGWGTAEQLKAVENADAQLKRILDASDLGSTLVIISADHGGSARGHGPEDVRSRTIPWLATGPTVRAGFDLTRLGKNFDVATFDTFSTACYVLGVAPEKPVDGKAIVEIFERAELMK
jgi:predicted AlkP superfamily pyrophosphatase or phosphodiesterase